MRILYEVNTSIIKDDENNETTIYGINAISENGDVLTAFLDVFDDYIKADSLANLCTNLGLAPEHLQNIIEDVL